VAIQDDQMQGKSLVLQSSKCGI